MIPSHMVLSVSSISPLSINSGPHLAFLINPYHISHILSFVLSISVQPPWIGNRVNRFINTDKKNHNQTTLPSLFLFNGCDWARVPSDWTIPTENVSNKQSSGEDHIVLSRTLFIWRGGWTGLAHWTRTSNSVTTNYPFSFMNQSGLKLSGSSNIFGSFMTCFWYPQSNSPFLMS